MWRDAGRRRGFWRVDNMQKEMEVKRTPLNRKTPLQRKPWRRKPRKSVSERRYTRCPQCTRSLDDGEQVYSCEVCHQDCCSSCSDTTRKHFVVCDTCLDGGYDDGWTQGVRFTKKMPKNRLRPRRKNKPSATKAEREYLAWVRQQPCWPHLCKSGLIHDSGQPHHLRTGMGMGQKAPDTDAFPICPDAHYEFHHTLGPKLWAKKYGKTEVEMLENFKGQPETQAKLKELGLI